MLLPVNKHQIPSIVVVLPVFNEADGIHDFIVELDVHLDGFERKFIVTDDCSTDDTVRIIKALGDSGYPIEVQTNHANIGHGPTVVSGFDRAILLTHSKFVITSDGDGQISGCDLRLMVDKSLEYDADIIEGVRVGRSDKWFRRIVSTLAQLLVFQTVRRWPKDANTPFRVLKREVLEEIRGQIPDSSLVPNLALSAISRAKNLKIHEIPVRCLPPRRDSNHVDHWKQRFKLLPSRRFMKFCFQAFTGWKQIREAIRNFEQTSTIKA